jgi:site-specific recombinase XerD
MNKKNTPITKLREQFIIYNKTTGKSPATVSWYEQKLELFTRFIGPNATLADVTVANARSFIADLQERSTRNLRNPYNHKREGSLPSSYIQGFARALRAFSSWLHEDGYTESNVLKTVKLPKIQEKVKEVLTDTEVQRLVSVFDLDEPSAPVATPPSGPSSTAA